jgi:glucan phosphoethanolaminetransferase (alkaline phosphatase superfamily)
MGAEMLWLILGILVLVGGAYALFRQLMTLRLSSIGLLLTWLIALVIIVTYAEQHDDLWEQYVANGVLAIGSALGGFLGALMFIREKFQSLNQRLDDHVIAEGKIFEQFERRVTERLDNMAERIDNLGRKR